ncbi:MAG: AzlC family ABC transporter permease [Actinophytocola sp.]|uniref:AzlC family ABC transporter permease n=1 Tax=Actinophytocola sp. TaxID=1872138 RepID=UPI003D6A13ED
MSEHVCRQRTRMAEFGAGTRDVVPIVIGAVPFGVLFGALAAQADFSATNTLLMSLIVYSGTIQLIGLNMIAAATPLPLIALASVIVNSRHVFYSAALTPYVRQLPVWWRVLLSYGMTDQIYALAERRYSARDGSTDKHWYMLATSATLFVAWFASTYVGFAFGDVLKDFDGLGLDFAIYATLVALAAPSMDNPRSIIVGVTAGLVALVLTPIPFQGGLFVAILAGVTVGVLSERWLRPKNDGCEQREADAERGTDAIRVQR